MAWLYSIALKDKPWSVIAMDFGFGGGGSMGILKEGVVGSTVLDDLLPAPSPMHDIIEDEDQDEPLPPRRPIK
jgi:hypothetical protein